MDKILDSEELAGLLKEVAGELQFDLGEANYDTALESLGLDSLDQYELITAVEDRLTLRIPDEKIGGIKTIAGLLDCLIELQRSAADGSGAA